MVDEPVRVDSVHNHHYQARLALRYRKLYNFHYLTSWRFLFDFIVRKTRVQPKHDGLQCRQAAVSQWFFTSG